MWGNMILPYPMWVKMSTIFFNPGALQYKSCTYARTASVSFLENQNGTLHSMFFSQQIGPTKGISINENLASDSKKNYNPPFVHILYSQIQLFFMKTSFL